MGESKATIATNEIGTTLRKAFFIFLSFILFFSFLNTREGVSQDFPQKRKIIFFDTFDFGKLGDRWHYSDKSETIRINYDPRYAHSGACSMEVTALPGKNTGGMARIRFMPGYDKVHVRWYCKFGADFDQGNLIKPKRKILIKRDRWYCMEMMLRANNAGRNNGEQAFWINGKLIGHFKNITWRYTNDLKINSFLLGLYIHDNKKINRIWYDDVVVSTGFIGL